MPAIRARLLQHDPVSTVTSLYEALAYRCSVEIEAETGQPRTRFYNYYHFAGAWRNIWVRLLAICAEAGIDPADYLRAQFVIWPKRRFNPLERDPVPPFPTPKNLTSKKAINRYYRWKQGLPINRHGDPTARAMKSGWDTVNRLMLVNQKRYPTLEAVLNNPDVRAYLPQVFIDTVMA